MSEVFYVYEHLRNDTNEIFYVGKGMSGSGRSNYKFNRNQHWHNIVNKAGYTVRKLAEGLTEELAFNKEIERIKELREIGIKLCNLTDGGDGTSGYKYTNEQRARLSEVMTGENHPMYGKKQSAQTVEKRTGENNGFYNKKHTEESLAKIREASSNPSDEVRAKFSASALARSKVTCPHCGIEGDPGGMTNWHFDNCIMNPLATPRKKVSEETRLKMSNSQQSQPMFTCPHCGKEGKGGAMKRFHFDNCILNPSAPPRPKVTCLHCGKSGSAIHMKNYHFDNCKKRVVIN